MKKFLWCDVQRNVAASLVLAILIICGFFIANTFDNLQAKENTQKTHLTGGE